MYNILFIYKLGYVIDSSLWNRVSISTQINLHGKNNQYLICILIKPFNVKKIDIIFDFNFYSLWVPISGPWLPSKSPCNTLHTWSNHNLVVLTKLYYILDTASHLRARLNSKNEANGLHTTFSGLFRRTPSGPS